MGDNTPKTVTRYIISDVPDTSKWPDLNEVFDKAVSKLGEKIGPGYGILYEYDEDNGGKITLEDVEKLDIRVGASAYAARQTVIGPATRKLKFEFKSGSDFEEWPVIKIKKLEFKEKNLASDVVNSLDELVKEYKMPLYWEVEQYMDDGKKKSTLWMYYNPEWYLVKFASKS